MAKNGRAERSEVEAMEQFARQLWQRYFRPKIVQELLSHSINGFKATVTANNGNGTLTVKRPFDSVSMTLKCTSALAAEAEAGDQVLVVELGDASNAFILCRTDLSGLGEGGGSAGDISYDNTGSGLTASNVQDAIDEVQTEVESKTTFWFGTRAEYNLLPSIDPDVCYCIEEGT